MSINIGPASSDDLRPKITVIGVGGAGGNAIANMMEAEIEGVDFIVANTDAQALTNASAERRIQLGPDITGGLGAGARPEVGKAAAEETVEEIEHALEGVNMCFIAAGMGGGTGTGAAPVIAEAARKKGVLTVGVVTKPFLFEGTRRMRAAEAGIEELQKHVDTLIVIPNQNLFLVAKAETTFKEAFMLADEVLQQGVRSITDLMVMPGLINLDFADVRSVMSEMGKAMMGTGEGEGENRALEAAERAIANPLLDGVSMAGAKGVIISIIGGEDMKLLEVDEAANHIRELVDEDANIIWGSAFNPDLDGKIRVSVVATGIDTSGEPAIMPQTSFVRTEARPPKRPTFDLPRESEVEDAPFELNEGLSADPSPQGNAPDADDMMELGEDDVAQDDYSADYATPEPSRGSGFSRFEANSDDEDDLDDVDDIVDPLAGLRNEHTERFDRAIDDAGMTPPADDAAHSDAGRSRGFAEDSRREREAPSRKRDDQAGKRNNQDELQLGSDQYSDSESGSLASRQRKHPLFPDQGSDRDDRDVAGNERGGAGARSAGGAPQRSGGSQGSTLFERMANLSRGSTSRSRDEDEDDSDDDGGSALNIPRFLGRQNNQ
ncbi:cell division protein FtsZ [Qipengyuania spongiae]|uniref:Cell division protein FtsZ n=1 Tax=Qipengyuania spongiae TaxID=2909673 RepID=A0ABY5T583_9SPHN|nr:cell division protein FtsZ [Qipengyuania spongiae]UVI40491.1 cell division protein FtsZ [Qipengyuania spongiae]